MIIKMIQFLFGKLTPEQKEFCLNLLKDCIKESAKITAKEAIKDHL